MSIRMRSSTEATPIVLDAARSIFHSPRARRAVCRNCRGYKPLRDLFYDPSSLRGVCVSWHCLSVWSGTRNFGGTNERERSRRAN